MFDATKAPQTAALVKLADMRCNQEEWSCYPDEVPVAWLEACRRQGDDGLSA